MRELIEMPVRTGDNGTDSGASTSEVARYGRRRAGGAMRRVAGVAAVMTVAAAGSGVGATAQAAAPKPGDPAPVTTRVSIDTRGDAAMSQSRLQSMSDNGRKVVFATAAPLG